MVVRVGPPSTSWVGRMGDGGERACVRCVGARDAMLRSLEVGKLVTMGSACFVASARLLVCV